MAVSVLQRLASVLTALIFLPQHLIAAPAAFSSSQSQLSALIGHAQNGSATDLYIHMEAPSEAGWGSIGIGQEMTGALFFVMYPNQDGSGATVSVRTASGNVMPQPIAGLQHRVTNSTNANGRVTADFVCYGCTHWATGSLDTSAASTDWIYAMGPGQPVASNDDAARIMKHANQGMFTANMASASMPAPGNDDAAPLLASSNNAGPAPAPPVTHASDSKLQMLPSWVIAHAAILSLAFFFFMPVGVILLRAPPVQRTGAAITLHYSSQGIAFVLVVAGLGIAINFSQIIPEMEIMRFQTYHQAIGLAATSAAIFQTALGLIHHLLFRKMGKRTFITYTHMVLGWLILTLGMLNAPIGFALIDDMSARNGMIAAVVIIFVITASVSAWGWSCITKNKRHQPILEKQTSGSDTRISGT